MNRFKFVLAGKVDTIESNVAFRVAFAHVVIKPAVSYGRPSLASVSVLVVTFSVTET
jgi:hypothetical protein